MKSRVSAGWLIALAAGMCGQIADAAMYVMPTVTVTEDLAGGGGMGGGLGPYMVPVSRPYQPIDGIEVVDPTPRRKDPGCEVEATHLNKTIAEAYAAIQAHTVLPGVEIMAGTKWGNPAYLAPGWKKRQDHHIVRHTEGPGLVRRYQVTVHFMYNENTVSLTTSSWSTNWKTAALERW